MQLKLAWLNSFWLIVPLLVWNVIYGPKLTDPRITSDANSPGWLLIAENIIRVAVFILPLLIPLEFREPLNKAGLAVYIFGTLIYFASWLPLLYAPDSMWSNSTLGPLAPRVTPFLSFLGIALIGQSWTYGVLAATFIFVHTWHGIENL